MAALTLKLKTSDAAGARPRPTDLAFGEMAINTSDGILYTRRSDDQIVRLGSRFSITEAQTAAILAAVLNVDAGSAVQTMRDIADALGSNPNFFTDFESRRATLISQIDGLLNSDEIASLLNAVSISVASLESNTINVPRISNVSVGTWISTAAGGFVIAAADSTRHNVIGVVEDLSQSGWMKLTTYGLTGQSISAFEGSTLFLASNGTLTENEPISGLVKSVGRCVNSRLFVDVDSTFQSIGDIPSRVPMIVNNQMSFETLLDSVPVATQKAWLWMISIIGDGGRRQREMLVTHDAETGNVATQIYVQTLNTQDLDYTFQDITPVLNEAGTHVELSVDLAMAGLCRIRRLSV